MISPLSRARENFDDCTLARSVSPPTPPQSRVRSLKRAKTCRFHRVDRNDRIVEDPTPADSALCASIGGIGKLALKFFVAHLRQTLKVSLIHLRAKLIRGQGHLGGCGNTQAAVFAAEDLGKIDVHGLRKRWVFANLVEMGEAKVLPVVEVGVVVGRRLQPTFSGRALSRRRSGPSKSKRRMSARMRASTESADSRRRCDGSRARHRRCRGQATAFRAS